MFSVAESLFVAAIGCIAAACLYAACVLCREHQRDRNLLRPLVRQDEL
jgi:hypothetical protein